MSERAIILVAEDEEDYVLLLKRAFSTAEIHNPLYFVSTGKELLAYLKGDDRYANRDEYPLPDLLLLDLKLPGYNGFEVLSWVRSHPGLTGLRIVVLTTSKQSEDVDQAYRLGANSFLVKPCDFQELINLTKMIKGYWLEQSKCPASFRPEKAGQTPVKPEERAESTPPSEKNIIPTVLLVDDDEEFMMLVRYALRKSGLQAALQYVSDGEEAMDYLSRKDKFANETNYPFPSLVLLDLKMPHVGGFQVLEWKCSHPELSELLFLVLSSSALERDREKAASLGAHGYLVKPADMEGLILMVAGLGKLLGEAKARV